MSSTFIRETGFVQTNATTPAFVFMNQYPNSTIVVDLIFTPIGVPTIPLKVTIQTGGMVHTWNPKPRPDGTCILKGIIAPHLGAIRAFGNSYTFQVTGSMEQGVLPAGLASIAAGVALTEYLPNRPDGSIETVMLPFVRWGGVMDIFAGIASGTSPYNKRMTVSLDFPAGTTSRSLLTFNEMPIIGDMEFRKITIPPACTVRCRLYGNVSAYFQWVWQRTQPTPDL